MILCVGITRELSSMMRFVILLAACAAVCSVSGCKSSLASEDLQALPASFKSHQNYALFGQLTACPRINEVLSDSLRFVIKPQEDINVVLLNHRLGDFMFIPATNYTGIVTFRYYVEDDEGHSEPSTVTINVQPKPVSPSVDVATHIIGLEDSNTVLDFQIDDVQDEHWNDLSVAICSCANDVTCSREDGCHCHLSLPDGWQIFNGDQQLTLEELKSLSPSAVGNLVLRAAPSSAARRCVDVHVIDPNNEEDPSMSKKSLNIHIHPVNTVLMKPQPVVSGVRPQASTRELPGSGLVNLTTSQGRPFVFSDFRVVDPDGINGTYMVTVSLDQGGLLWVRQDLRQDVVFLPLSEELHSEDVSSVKVYRLLNRFGTFRSENRSLGLEQINNGKKVLGFIGTLEGINAVLSTLTYVPWCPDWPVPPSWPVPSKSWMIPADGDDPHYPVIWPQWYPRLWYPFLLPHWTMWPRVLPPWWLSSPCSNWTSTVRMTVREVPPSLTCQEPKEEAAQSVSEWSASISVNTSGKALKSLITNNLFTYFQPDLRAVIIDTIHLRSLQYYFGENVTINLTVSESNYATVEFPSTGLNYTLCHTVEQCNEQLTNIKVTFKNDVQDICLVTVRVDLYKQGSTKLLDTLVVWAVNTTRQCADITSTHPNFELIPHGQRRVTMRQGSVNYPLNLISSIDGEDITLPGILHVMLYAEHGIITMKVPDDLRIYSDHMGQHESISSYLCIAGPVPMVLEALAAARFTPFEFLSGQTVVTMDYRMPSTASQLLYGNVQPFQRTHVTIEVVGGMMPYMPVALHPQEMCVSNSTSLYINQTAVLRRFKEDERVTVSFSADRGSLQLDTNHKALYECPVQEDPLVAVVDGGECRDHSDCSDNLLCCPIGPAARWGFTCMEGTPKVLLPRQLNTGMIGNTHDINEMMSLNTVRYLPASCNNDEETYTDTIHFRIYPNRNPEGDNVRANIPVLVTCNMKSPDGLVDNCEWSDWTPCLAEGSVCGLGSQQHHQLCSSEEMTETRSCLNCTCAPVLTLRTDVSPHMEGCTSDGYVSTCPDGCSMGTYHREIVNFSCVPAREEPLLASIMIHDTCVCDYCSSYQFQREN